MKQSRRRAPDARSSHGTAPGGMASRGVTLPAARVAGRRRPGASEPVVRPDAPPARLRDLLRLLDGHRGAVLVALSVALVGAALGLLQPLLAGRLVEAVRTGGLPGQLVLALVLLFLAQVVADRTGRYLLERVGERVVLTARVRLVDRLLRLRTSAYGRYRRGDLLSRAANDTAALNDVAARGAVDVLVGALTALGAVGLMLFLDPVLLGVVVAVFALATLGVVAVLSAVQAASAARQNAVGAFSADLERALSAIRTVRVARAEGREGEAIAASARSAHDAGLRVAWLSAAATPAVQVAATGSFLVVLVVGGVRVSSGDLALGTLVSVLLYASFLVAPLGSLLEGVTVLKVAQGALARVQELHGLPVEEELPAVASAGTGGPAPAPRAPLLRFDDVSYSYEPGGPAALRGVSFSVPAGARVALVGPSGAGKSTVLALTCRFHEPDSGTISYRGRPAVEVPLRDARGLLALVEQDSPVLFGSFRDNLTFGADDAADEELDLALRRVNLTELVERLPHGLDTPVGEHGTRLSGGERQRLALARALVTRPALLLLDEPTANLDTANEQAVLSALDGLPAGCAVLVVAHRLSTVLAADHIVVLAEGAVVAEGSPAELSATSATFRALFGQADLAMSDCRPTGALRDG